jgi:hypothetical protein
MGRPRRGVDLGSGRPATRAGMLVADLDRAGAGVDHGEQLAGRADDRADLDLVALGGHVQDARIAGIAWSPTSSWTFAQWAKKPRPGLRRLVPSCMVLYLLGCVVPAERLLVYCVFCV